jgi:type I restriction enzyme R subunit
MSRPYDETSFESIIEFHLLANGYASIAKSGYDLERAIFPEVAIDFIRTTQPKEWQRLQALHGDDTAKTILGDLVQWLDTYGALAVLRNGFKCYGRNLRIAFFKPAHGMNPELAAQYQANRVGITRQLRYSPRNTNELDLVISLNGIPLVTAELKNPMTGQTVDDAMEQYQKDRDHRERLFEFKKRTLVHFAIDTEQVFMTTRLASNATYFLPFNQGNNGGAGNPPAKSGSAYRTAYWWQEVMQRDSLLDLFARFLHLQVDERFTDEGRKLKSEKLIFPRYHQLQAVRELESTARQEGVGNNYLIEHSAGSGKSNTIGWLAHRLASLHDANDQRVFGSVIVITDRKVLDKQLQDTIYQFEHRMGVVQKIDKDSRQLAEALESGVPIIISTLQKFPYVARQLLKMAEESGQGNDGVLLSRPCAVIVDEAHSSQSGETATDLKGVLGGTQLREEAARYAVEEGVSDLDELFRSMAKRGKQANLSFFAFTATPKHKTLAVFGRAKDGKKGQPFHRYTMRQAIEENFILDVLRNYTTYKTFYQLVKACESDPNVERKQAARALNQFMRLHPYNIAQKTQVMVEHFNAVTRHRIGGKAKAMVVTGSRLEAVRYKQSFDKYIRNKNYSHIKTLVAFSGQVEDDEVAGKLYTEVDMNGGIRETELPEKFASHEYQVLLVAEKYQTGFDQPLLHTMYVDKRLAGIQAVQTLSRLNRTHPLKDDTFVLDFVNDREEIRDAFEQYYEGAEMGDEATPAQLYQVKAELDASGIYFVEEVERFAAIYFKPRQRQTANDHREMNAVLDPVVERFSQWQQGDAEEAENWRGKLGAFRNLYAFLSQVIPYQDSDLESLYTFFRFLALKLPKRGRRLHYQFDDEVRLEYYRLQKISEGSIVLGKEKAEPLHGPTASGSGGVHEETVALSRLVDAINERFGTDFTEADQLFFDQIIESAIEDSNLQEVAAANSEDKFALFFNNVLETLFIERMEQNEDIFARFMNEPEFQKMVNGWMAARVYKKLKPAIFAP